MDENFDRGGIFEILDHFLFPFCHFKFMDPKLLFNLAALPIPNLITFKGKDINDFNFSQDNFHDASNPIELDELGFNLSKIGYNISAIANKTNEFNKTEAILNTIEPYEIDFFHDQAIEIYKWLFPCLDGFLVSINALLPSNPCDEEKKEIKKIKIVIEKLSKGLTNLEDTVKALLDISFFDLLSENNKKSSITIKLQKLFYCILPTLIIDGYITLISIVAFYHAVYERFCIPEENRTQPDNLSALLVKINLMMDSCGQKLDVVSTCLQETNTIVKSSEKNLNTINKKADQLLQGQEETQRKIIVQGDQSSRRLEKVEEKVDKRNRADKRKPLTQEECANLLYKQKVIFCKKKEDYISKVGITSTRVKCPEDETMVLRTIQRWDQYLATDGEKGTKPPKGYSREKSIKEFDLWAEVFEQIAYEKWEKKQPIIRRKNKQTDGIVMPYSTEDEENLEDEDDDFETRGQQNLADRFDHSRKDD